MAFVAIIGLQSAVLGGVAHAESVGSFVDSTGCSTMVVRPLSEQIAEEVECMMSGLLVPFEEGDGLVFAGTVLPWIGAEARDDLKAAAAEGDLQITSAYRTVAQQYLLYAWFQAGRCGITAAAQPGSSNHESGRAVDISNWEERAASLEAHGWSQTVPGDEVHFDHLDSPDIRGTDVLAFQRLWNRNNPGMPIDEDGEWGPMTQMALSASPAEGFVIGAECDDDGGGGGGGDTIDPPGGGGDDDDAGGLIGGCSTGGGGASLLLALLPLGLLARRRTR